MILTNMVQLFTKQFLIKIVLTVVLSDQLSYCWHQLIDVASLNKYIF